MPTLRQITCGIELGPGNIRLKEYGHKVADGAVEAYIVAPEDAADIPFHVRITSDGYIAPGLAAYVFMDGEYQCNRNRLRLRFPEDGMSAEEYQIDFKLRQKEEKTSDGTFIARDWYFTPLNTGNADKASSTKNFRDNVGTIEVIILRCKDGAEEEVSTDPAQTTVSRNPLPTSRTPSKGAPSVPAPSVRAPSGRAPQSRAPAAKSDSVGGMMGIFDGASDDPGYYKQYRPRNIVGQEHLPGHKWDTSSGQYRYFDDQDPFVNFRGQGDNRNGGTFPADRYRPQTYTVGGGFSYQESVQPRSQRDDAPKTFVPQSSPEHDFTLRRRKLRQKDSEPAPRSTYDFTRRRKQEGQQAQGEHGRSNQEEKDTHRTARPQQRPVQHEHIPEHHEQRREHHDQLPEHYKQRAEHHEQRAEHHEQRPEHHEQRAKIPEQPGSGFAFVEDCSQQIQKLIERFLSEGGKYDALIEDAKRYYDREDIYRIIVKAAHRKHHEITGIVGRLGEVYRVVEETMNGMDRPTWRRASNLLYEKDLYPPHRFDIQPPPEKDTEGGRGAPPSLAGGRQASGWGGSVVSDWKQVGEGAVGEQKNKTGWDNSPGSKGAASWGNGKSKKATDDGWGNGDSKSNKPEDNKINDGWGTDDKSNKPASGWGEDDNNSKGKSAAGWGDDDNNNNNKADAGDWGDTKNNNDSWGDDAGKEKQRGSRHSRSHIGASVNDGAGSDSYSFGEQLKPVIKPYWSEWTKKQVMPKPKVQPREVYEYPALPSPVLPGGKSDKGVTQAVRAGRGANYAHKLHRPEYLDTMSKPYAVFTFKYRSKAALEKILGREVDDGHIGEAKEEAEKHRLLSLPKDELVEELMRKASIAARSRASSKAASKKGDWDKAASNKAGGDWGASDNKPTTPEALIQSQEVAIKAPTNDSWGHKSVKPSDSISQHGASEWGAPPANNEWGSNHRSGSEKNGKSKTGNGGWDVKSVKSARTAEHWAEDLPTTKPNTKW